MAAATEGVDETAVDPTKLIVNFLPPTVTSATLKELFSQYGTVEDANVVLDRLTKASRGYGFVKFSTEESAQRAIDMMNDKTIDKSPDAKPIHVAISKPPKVEVNLYIGGLLNTVKQEELAAEFARFGTVVECNIPLDRSTNLGKGFGFVKLDSKSAAHEAIETLGGKVVESLSGTHALTVKRAENNNSNHGRNQRFGGMDRRHFAPRMMPAFPPQPVSFEGVCVFIYNIPHTMNEHGLQELFRPYGTVTCARVMRNPNRTSKGFGFVNMAATEEANNAINHLNGQALIPDKPLQVSLKRP